MNLPGSDPDDEGGYAELMEDGWTHDEIRDRTFLDAQGRYLGPVTEVVHQADTADELLAKAGEMLQRVRNFNADMRAKGIHVGVNGYCVTCDKAWPCLANVLETPDGGGG